MNPAIDAYNKTLNEVDHVICNLLAKLSYLLRSDTPTRHQFDSPSRGCSFKRRS